MKLYNSSSGRRLLWNKANAIFRTALGNYSRESQERRESRSFERVRFSIGVEKRRQMSD